MATAIRTIIQRRSVLRGISYQVYVAIREPEDNNHVRMEYRDGVLKIMSPGYVHDGFAERSGVLIRAVCAVFEIPLRGARTTTLRRLGPGPERGVGKEPDASFYFANQRRIAGNTEINLEVDPPPDLAIEVESSHRSRDMMEIYARLKVPEVWRFHVRSGKLQFDALQPYGSYLPVERSLNLPMLTPDLVLELLARCPDQDEMTWDREVRDWLRDILLPRFRQEGGG